MQRLRPILQAVAPNGSRVGQRSIPSTGAPFFKDSAPLIPLKRQPGGGDERYPQVVVTGRDGQWKYWDTPSEDFGSCLEHPSAGNEGLGEGLKLFSTNLTLFRFSATKADFDTTPQEIYCRHDGPFEGDTWYPNDTNDLDQSKKGCLYRSNMRFPLRGIRIREDKDALRYHHIAKRRKLQESTLGDQGMMLDKDVPWEGARKFALHMHHTFVK